MERAPGETHGPAEVLEDLRDRLPAELAGLRRHAAALLSGGRGSEVDDVVQETLTRALNYAGGFDASRPLGPWLRRMALRVVLDQRAARGRAPEPLEETQDPAAPPDAHVALADEVERALAGLDPLDRTLLQRFHQVGESLPELSRSLGLPLGTVKARLHRARRRIAERRDGGGGAR